MFRLILAFALAALAAWPVAAQISPPIEPAALPSDRAPWSLDDAGRAAAALHRLAQETPADLPRYSVSSQAAFSRLTAPALLEAPPRADTLARVAYLHRATRLYEGVMLLYAGLQKTHGGYDIEVAELAQVLLRASARLVDAVAAVPASGDEAEAYAAGVARLRGGLADALRGVVQMAADENALSQPARERLLLYATRESRTIAPLLAEADKQALAAELTAAADTAAARPIAQGLRALREAYAR